MPDPVVLEPIEEITVTIPESYAGAVMGDISASRGRVTGMETDERGDTVVIAQAPLAELTDYSTRLRSITRGTGDFTMKPAGYEQVPYDVQAKLSSAMRRPRQVTCGVAYNVRANAKAAPVTGRPFFDSWGCKSIHVAVGG